MADDIDDAGLEALFAGPDPTPDLAFVERVARGVRAEQAFRTARARAWRRFGAEAVVTVAVTIVFASLWAFAESSGRGAMASAAPTAAAAVFMLGLWVLLALRPAAQEG